jgi:hypothetical protein
MGLSSIDITKVKRLSLKEVKLPAPERRVEPTPLVKVERPPTNEEIIYSKLVALYPILEEAVERFDLVSISTGERIKKVALVEAPEAQIMALANRVVEPENNFTKRELIGQIKRATNVSQERAEIDFNLMLEAQAIGQTINPERYYLLSSTPF